MGKNPAFAFAVAVAFVFPLPLQLPLPLPLPSQLQLPLPLLLLLQLQLQLLSLFSCHPSPKAEDLLLQLFLLHQPQPNGCPILRSLIAKGRLPHRADYPLCPSKICHPRRRET
jgi:hypothetical protein